MADEIPEDVRTAALAHYIAYGEANAVNIAKDPTEAELLEVVGRAILAERERCAAIAETKCDWHTIGHEWERGFRRATEEIATAIRGGSQ